MWIALSEMCQWRRETLDKESIRGRVKKYLPEQAMNLLRQIKVAVANDKMTAQASNEAGIVEWT